MDVIESIRQQQIKREKELGSASLDRMIKPLAHRPEICYIGCVDARLKPLEDIGFDNKQALISRRLGGLVQKNDADLQATLEFWLENVKLDDPTQIKHIIIAGHTHCGAINECFHEHYNEHTPNMKAFLETNLGAVRDAVKDEAQGVINTDIALRELEKASVHQSYNNLMEFPCVKKAIAEGKADVHAWVLDTANKRIYEMEQLNKRKQPEEDKPIYSFVAMGKKYLGRAA